MAASLLAGESLCCNCLSYKRLVTFAEGSGRLSSRPNPEIYEAYTGKANNIVLENLQWLLQNGDPNRIKVRIPHIPDFNSDDDVERSKEQLAAMGVENFDIFQYIIR